MNEHTIVNGIFAAIAIVVFVVRVARKLGAGARPKTDAAREQLAEAKSREAARLALARQKAKQQQQFVRTNASAPSSFEQQPSAKPVAAAKPADSGVRGSLMRRIAAAMDVPALPAAPQASAPAAQRPQSAAPSQAQRPAAAATGARPRPPAPPRASDSAFPAEAAAAFPVLDLTLPGDANDLPGSAPARPRARRTNVLGGAGWANAIVAMEVLGPPVSLRSGATLGAPHAF